MIAYTLAVVQDAGTVQALSNPNIRLTMFAPGETFLSVRTSAVYMELTYCLLICRQCGPCGSPARGKSIIQILHLIIL